jgi:hypothetical protein
LSACNAALHRYNVPLYVCNASLHGDNASLYACNTMVCAHNEASGAPDAPAHAIGVAQGGNNAHHPDPRSFFGM